MDNDGDEYKGLLGKAAEGEFVNPDCAMLAWGP
jgi:hypothetical protein